MGQNVRLNDHILIPLGILYQYTYPRWWMVKIKIGVLLTLNYKSGDGGFADHVKTETLLNSELDVENGSFLLFIIQGLFPLFVL